MRLVLVFLLTALMLGLRLSHEYLPVSLGQRTGLAFGFILLCGFLIGELIARWRIPRITGYLLAGILYGPHVLDLVDHEVVANLRLVDELALCMIALTAGAELRMERLRARLRGIASIVIIQMPVVFVAMVALLLAAHRLLPFTIGLTEMQLLGVAVFLGMFATAKSPATTVAVIVESRARGPMTDTILGATVVKDIVVLVGFAAALAIFLPAFNTALTPGETPRLTHLLLEVGVSPLVGAGFGLLMILYLRFIGQQPVLFVLATAFVIIVTGHALHLDVLLMSVSAGFVLSNLSRQGEAFLHGLERASAPVFLIFFCLAGATLHIELVVSMWYVVLLYVGARAALTWAGTWLGAFVGREPESVRKLAWTGFLGQAGVSLGLAAMLRKTLPEMVHPMVDLVIGAIVVNQMLGPILFRWALERAGETTGG